MELTVDRLTKQYKNKIAVDRVSCRFRQGVYGLLGGNGAGKTTFMRMLCGILTPTGGEVTFDGIGVDTEEYRSALGYLPQDFGYYPNFTGLDFMLYMATLALLGEPKILVLDEPTAGLDPKERVRFRNLVKELGKDSIVILSTHIVSDVEQIADTILMMKDGQMIFQGAREGIKEDLEEFYLENFADEQ